VCDYYGEYYVAACADTDVSLALCVQVQFWQQGNKPGTLREADISPEYALANRVGDTWKATIEDLLPNTNMEGTVAVMNNYYVAQPSAPFKFLTLPGCESS
jgi:hypothetical protein